MYTKRLIVTVAPIPPSPSALPGTKHKQGRLRQTEAQFFKYPLTLWQGGSAERASWLFAAPYNITSN